MKLIDSIVGYALIPSPKGLHYYVYLTNGKRIRVTRKTFNFFIKRG